MGGVLISGNLSCYDHILSCKSTYDNQQCDCIYSHCMYQEASSIAVHTYTSRFLGLRSDWIHYGNLYNKIYIRRQGKLYPKSRIASCDTLHTLHHRSSAVCIIISSDCSVISNNVLTSEIGLIYTQIQH